MPRRSNPSPMRATSPAAPRSWSRRRPTTAIPARRSATLSRSTAAASAGPNSVAWQFENRGVILVDGDRYGEDDLIAAIDAGAEDVAADGDVLKVTTAAGDLAAVRSAIEESGVEIESAELSMEPTNTVEVGESEAPALLRLMDALRTRRRGLGHANFDVPEILERGRLS